VFDVEIGFRVSASSWTELVFVFVCGCVVVKRDLHVTYIKKSDKQLT
jgi:hypothetical protein